MKKVLVQTANHISEYRAKITLAILAACLMTALFYSYNLYALISRTVAIEQVQSRAAAISSTINDLDAKYLSLSSNITPDVLAQYGLEPGVVSMYITRQSVSAASVQAASLGNLAAGGHEL